MKLQLAALNPGSPVSAETLFAILGLIFLLSLSGTVVGLVKAQPWGQAWSWKRAWVLIPSAVVLVMVVGYAVTLFVALRFFGENR